MTSNINSIIDEIWRTPHWRVFRCALCGGHLRVHALQIQVRCGSCGRSTKCRAFGGIGTEIQDVIDAVLEWASEGEDLEAVMRRHREIIEDPSEAE